MPQAQAHEHTTQQASLYHGLSCQTLAETHVLPAPCQLKHCGEDVGIDSQASATSQQRLGAVSPRQCEIFMFLFLLDKDFIQTQLNVKR